MVEKKQNKTKKHVPLAAWEAETFRHRFLSCGGWWSPQGYEVASFLCSVFLLRCFSRFWEVSSRMMELSTTQCWSSVDGGYLVSFSTAVWSWRQKEFLRKSSQNVELFHALKVFLSLGIIFVCFERLQLYQVIFSLSLILTPIFFS